MRDDPIDVRLLFANLLSHWQDVGLLWELGAIAAGIALGWLAERRADQRLVTTEGPWRYAHAALRRAVFPLTLFLALLAARFALERWQGTHLLPLVVPLAGALVLIRLAVYLLRLVFAPARWVQASEKAIAWTIWVGFALHITGVLPDILRVLEDIGFTMGKHRISLLLVLQATFTVALALLVAMTAARIAEGRIMNATALDVNVRVMANKVVRALLILAAVLVALPAVGIDLTMLSVFGGALGVGLGLGLQKVASNYVSGFIILLDRSLTIGDMVTVDNRAGQLTRMTARYIVVRGLDGVEAIIPNETVITSTVLNLTHSDRRVRIGTPVQVAYGTDLEIATAAMLDAARTHPRVLKDPSPSVLVQRLADSGIDLELGVWIADPEAGQANVRSDLNRAILAAFRAHRIEIPYPQREIRVLDRKDGGGPSPAR